MGISVFFVGAGLLLAIIVGSIGFDVIGLHDTENLLRWRTAVRVVDRLLLLAVFGLCIWAGVVMIQRTV